MKDRRILKYIIDLLLLTVTLPIAFILRLEGSWMPHLRDIGIILAAVIPVNAVIIFYLNLFRQSWHNVSVRDLLKLTKGAVIYLIALMVIALGFGSMLFIPMSIPFIAAALAVLLLGGIRLLARIRYEYSAKRISGKVGDQVKKVLIIGAGDAGNLLLREMLRHPSVGMSPIGFLDNDKSKHKERFMGVPVLGTLEDLPKIVDDHDVDLTLIAMPTAPGKTIREVVEMAKKAGVDFQIMPGIYELISGKFNISQLREVDVQDLLRRDHVEFDFSSISKYLNDKVVMVTGAGGSIGSEIVRQISKCGPKQILLLGRGENSIFKIESECCQIYPAMDYKSLIIDIKDKLSLENAFLKYKPQVVFHTAAHKHVLLMEQNPEQAILNNVGGTRNIVNMALKYNVERFVNISSDKSVNPTSVMGASKRVAEFIVEWASCHAKEGQQFVSVRFGNVLGSRGSVIPLFKRQIQKGGPVTITHPDMTRYFMTIPEASQLVLQAGAMGGNGSVYVLDMGEPVKIIDVANDLIKLSGLIPEEDIEILYTGIKPGEKLYEELLTAEESTTKTLNAKIFAAKTSGFPKDSFEAMLEKLFDTAFKHDGTAIREQLKQIIPTYALKDQKIKS